jgi:hypothetical protein
MIPSASGTIPSHTSDLSQKTLQNKREMAHFLQAPSFPTASQQQRWIYYAKCPGSARKQQELGAAAHHLPFLRCAESYHVSHKPLYPTFMCKCIQQRCSEKDFLTCPSSDAGPISSTDTACRTDSAPSSKASKHLHHFFQS